MEAPPAKNYRAREGRESSSFEGAVNVTHAPFFRPKIGNFELMKAYYETIWILSTLLHYANLSASSARFYALKNKLLDRYGKTIGYDVQYLDGKKCYTCGGTGVYTGYYWESGEAWHDTCNRCWRGWFKPPVWNVLLKRKFGKYTFHTPIKRCHSKKELGEFVSENFYKWSDE